MEQRNFSKEARQAQDKDDLLAILLEEAGIAIVAKESAIAPRTHAEIAEHSPLSYPQQAQWFLHKLEPNNPFYNICATIHLTGNLDEATLEKSLSEIIRRHEVLRATFTTQDDQPIQIINSQLNLPLSVIDLQGRSASEQATEQQRLAREAAQQPFDLTRDRLLRVTLLRLERTTHVLVLVIHHIISDGFTLGVFVQELGAIYDAFSRGAASPLPELSIQYADYALWQRQQLQGARRDRLLNYWKHQLAGMPPLLELPCDRPRPPVQSFRGETISFQIDLPLTQQLNKLSQTSGNTLFMTLLAAFTVLLHRYSGQSDIVVGSPIANRHRPELENLIGFFANNLVLRTQFSEALTFRQLLTQVQAVTLDAYAHQDCPFETLVEALQPTRDLSSNPLFQVVFALQNAPLPSIDLTDLTMTPAVNLDTGTVRSDLEVHLWEGADGISGGWVYSTDLFKRATMQRMAAHFHTLLAAIVAEPDQLVSMLPLLTATEQQQVQSITSAALEGQSVSGGSGLKAMLPVGFPAHCSVYVLDSHLQPIPLGVVGEIYISGMGVAWEEFQAEVGGASGFVENPFSDIPGDRLFKTGELGRLREQGLERVGSLKRQAWIKGFQVNLAEVEAALLQAPEVIDCHVLMRQADPDGPQLVAYMVLSGQGSPEQLSCQLQSQLQSHLRPSAYVPIANLPLTAAGAVDEQALVTLPVIDPDLIQRWEAHLNSQPDIEQAVVVVRSQLERTPPLHLSELLPAGDISTTLIDDETVTAPVHVLEPVKSENSVLALSDGGPLILPSDSPETLAEALLTTAATYPDKGAIHIPTDGAEISQPYHSLLDTAKCILTGLSEKGLKPGDRAILQIQSLPDYFSVFWACVLGGIVPVTVAIAPTYETDNAVVKKLLNAWELLEHPVILASDAVTPSLHNLQHPLSEIELNVLSIGELRQHAPARQLHASQPDDVVFLQLSSGSTGVSKCIQETHRGIIHHIHASAQFNDYTSADISLNWLSMDHVVPLLMYHIKDVYLSCQQIQTPSDAILANPLKWLDLIETYQVTHTWSPNFGYRLLSDAIAAAPNKTWDLSSMKYFVNAGEQVTLPVIRDFLELTAPFGVAPHAMQSAYGMAEACTAIVYQNFDFEQGVHYLQKCSLQGHLQRGDKNEATTVNFIDQGAAIPGVKIRIVNRDNQLLSEEVIGRVQVTGEIITPGYLKNPAANQEAFTTDGWYNTGDLGFLSKGHLVVTGREKELIIIQGVNYYCYDIEDIIKDLEGVESTCVGACGLDDPSTGTEVLAIFYAPVVEGILENINTIKAIRTKIASQLGINPTYVIPVSQAEFPKTTSGKIQRAKLKSLLQTGHFQAHLKQIDIALENANTLPDWFYRKIWRRKAAMPNAFAPQIGTVLVFADALGLGDYVCEQLKLQNRSFAKVEAGVDFVQLSPTHYQINPNQAEHYQRLVASLTTNSQSIGHILHLWTYDEYLGGMASPTALEQAQGKGLYSLLWLVQSLSKTSELAPCRLLVISSHSQSILPADEIAYEKTPILGLIKTIAQEMSGLSASHLDLATDLLAENGDRILQELCIISVASEVAYRNGQRWVAALEKANLTQSKPQSLPLKPGGTYLLSGGLGGIGVEIARYLLTHYQARLLLIGRTPLPEPSTWQTHLEQNREQDNPLSDRIRAYQSLESLTGEIRYEAIDICNQDQLQTVVHQAQSHWGADLNGVIHLAGVYQERMLLEETPADLAAVLRPKMVGTWNLHHLLQDRTDAFFIHFSSVLGFFGGATVAAYAAANSFIDSFAAYQQFHSKLQSYCFAWSTWDEIGISRGYPMKDLTRARGYAVITPAQGLQSLLAGLRREPAQWLVGLAGHNRYLRRYVVNEASNLQQLTAYVTQAQIARTARTARTEGGLALKMCDRFGTQSICEYIALEKMPLTTAGEIDRAALMALTDQSHHSTHEKIAPKTEIERQIAQIWQEVLAIPQVGIHDNFFELGGQSLLATQVIARLRQVFSIEIPLQTLFELPTISQLAERIEVSREVAPVLPSSEAIHPIPRTAPLPLSFAQQRLWFLVQLGPERPTYNVPRAYRLTGVLNMEALKQSLNAIVRRHESLRTSFPAVTGQPTSVIAPVMTSEMASEMASELPLELPLIDLQRYPSNQREAQLQQHLAEEIHRPFDLAHGPLLRAKLLRLDSEEHVLQLTQHHIIFDVWALDILLRELSVFYLAYSNGQTASLPDLPIQYVDFAVWQRQWLQADVLGVQFDYWKQQLSGDLPVLALPTDRPRPPVQTYRGAEQLFSLSKSLTESLASLSQQQGVTLFITLLAAFQTLLHRYSGQDDIIVGSPIAGRHRLETEGLIGLFVNLLALRTQLTGDPSFQELLHRVRKVVLGAYNHQNLPFEKLVEELQPERDLSRAPLFQVMFAFQNTQRSPLELTDLTIETVSVHNDASQFDLTLYMEETAQGLSGALEYNTDLFDAATITRMVGHFQTLLQGIATNADQHLSELPLLTPTEQHQLLTDWNDTHTQYPQTVCIHQLFEAQVEKTPDAIALIFEHQQLTYRELNHRANQLAHHLQTLEVKSETLVGICLERSLEMLIALLAILKVGSAYVPLDPSFPSERLAFMLEDAQVKVLVTQSDVETVLPETQAQVVRLDLAEDAIATQPTHNPDIPITSSQLAYVIYTSGSTGNPKGVMIEHQSLTNFLSSMREVPGLTASDTLLAVTTISFDIAGLELYLPLLVGAKVVLVSREVAIDAVQLWSALRQSEATVMQATPATWRSLLTVGWPTHYTLKILCGGEALPPNLAEQLLANGSSLWNMYGPTETTIWSAVKHTESAHPPITIGQPIANTQFYLLDPSLQPIPIGVIGELYIGGNGLARGYLNRPKLTAQKFIPSPFPLPPSPRLYKTGDLARYLPTGELEILGRCDDQIKLRGFRIELGEIEALLGQHPSVKEAVVVLRETVAGDKRLVAYMIAGQNQAPNNDQLRNFLKQKLPDYMTPSTFMWLERFPLTPNGKIDRRALPAPDPSALVQSAAFVLPRTFTEQQLADIWTDVLKLDNVGIHDNFFEIGGHSLLATQVMARLRQAFSVELLLHHLFELPTIAELAEKIEVMRESAPVLPSARVIRSVARHEDLPLTFDQERMWFFTQLEPDSAALNLPLAYRLTGLLNVQILEQSLREIRRRHESLRTLFVVKDEQPKQIITSNIDVALSIVTLQDLSPDQQQEAVQRHILEEAEYPFDLTQDPLLRTKLLHLSAEEHILLLTTHQIIADGWSLDILCRELTDLYQACLEGQPSPLPDLPIQYGDFAVWQRHQLQDTALKPQLEYWQQQLRGSLPVLTLPTDRPRPPVQTYQGACHISELPKQLAESLKALSQAEKGTLFITLLAAFKTLLYSYSGQDDIITGSPIAGRDQLETEDLIGLFAKVLVCRTSLADNPSFRDLLARERDVVLAAYRHQDVPFSKLVEALQLARDPSRSPLYQASFALQSFSAPYIDLPGLTTNDITLHNNNAKFDITLLARETPTGLIGWWEYNTDLFDAATIIQMSQRFQTLLEGIVANPDQSLSALAQLIGPIRSKQIAPPDDGFSPRPLSEATTLITLENFLSDLHALGVKLWLEDNNLRYKAPKDALTPTLLTQLRARKTEIIEFLRQAEQILRS